MFMLVVVGGTVPVVIGALEVGGRGVVIGALEAEV